MTPPRNLARALLVVFVVVGLMTLAIVPMLGSVQAAPPALSPATHVVISEFRPRGPGGVSDEFVELFNPTSSSVDITGWSLARSPFCSPGVMHLTPAIGAVILVPGKHFLIGGTAYKGTGTKAPDLVIALSLSEQGGVGLYDASPTPVLIDAVGMCSGTELVELPALDPFPTLSLDESYARIAVPASGECVDTDNNHADFFLRKPSNPQNLSSPLTKCGTSTPTSTSTPPSTATFTPTSTSTRTSTATFTPTSTPTPGYHDIIISEVGWMGTQYSTADQWIELYNNTKRTINLTDWQLKGDSGTIGVGGVLNLKRKTGTNTIGPHEFFIIAQNKNVFQNLDVEQVDGHLKLWNCSGCGETLSLEDPFHSQIDTADYLNTAWPAGDLSSHSTMERTGSPGTSFFPGDSPYAWFTFAGKPKGCINTSGRIITDHDGGNEIQGTPGCPNWATTVTITPSPLPTNTRKPTGIPPKPYAHMVINEFLPRAGFDWNGDGTVDVYDEFIEVENLGPIDGNLGGWSLDAVGDTISSYTLPSLALHPGQRALYYGSTTGILLHDSGATVRLINPNGYIVDARGYGIVDRADRSWCRIPDGAGYWTHPCFPTPGLENSLTGTIPRSPPYPVYLPPVCLLPDTAPDAFHQAECDAFGADILNPAYWDDQAGEGQFVVPDPHSKWHTIVR